MQAYLNRIDGIDDGIITMFLSKRSLTREKELHIRKKVIEHSISPLAVFADQEENCMRPIGSLISLDPELQDWMEKLLKWGTEHITMLRFIDLSFSIYGMHRGGQDDTDAHGYRMQNRVIRNSTRLADFKNGEMSEFYQGKIVPTDIALAYLGIETPDELTVDGQVYVRATNGYILKGHENEKDYKRGLYMLSIPSDFVYRICLTEFAHVYKMRRWEGTANEEVKTAIESQVDQLQAATMGLITRETLLTIKN